MTLVPAEGSAATGERAGGILANGEGVDGPGPRGVGGGFLDALKTDVEAGAVEMAVCNFHRGRQVQR